jgi:hypothetical protein
MVCNIDGCINLFQEDKILFHPFAKSKILDVNVSSPTSWFLRVGHSRASGIVFICDGGRFLWNFEVPQNATDKEAHSADICGCHELSLGG